MKPLSLLIRGLLTLAVCVPLQVGLAPQPALGASTSWTKVELPAPRGYPQAWATAVNNRGTIVGAAHSSDWSEQLAVRWDRGRVRTLRLPSGATWSEAHDVNDRGWVVGSARPTDGAQHAVVWRGGRALWLPERAGTSSSVATGINAAGDIAGSMDGQMAVWRVRTSMPRVGPSGGAIAISDSAVAAGALSFAGEPVPNIAMTWSPGAGPRELGPVAGEPETVARDIDEVQGVVGQASTVGLTHTDAVRWVHGVASILPLLPGYTDAAAEAINSSGQVVGRQMSPSLAATVPVLWDGSETVELPGVEPSEVNANIWVGANDISDRGVVVGFRQLDGVYAPLMWTASSS
jgi:uncharacterized membrane protein